VFFPSASADDGAPSSVPSLLPVPPSSMGIPSPPGPMDPPFGTNVRVSEDIDPLDGDNQNEIAMAVAPDGRIHMAWNDWRPAVGAYRCGYSYSTDGGATWSANRIFHLPPWPSDGDPVVVVDANNNVYVICMGFGGGSQIAAYKSTDGGVTFASPTIASDTTTGLNDKPWAHVVGTTVHVCYANFGASPNELRYTRSVDGGATWAPTQVLDRSGNGCQFASDNAGNLYIAWWGSNEMRFVKSTNGGATWTVPAQAATVSWSSLPGPRAYPIPTMAADRTSGNVYLAWHDNDGSGGWDIRIARTTNGGATWTRPVVAVNDVPTDRQFMPALAVAPDGTIHMIWYDRRTGNLDIRYARSTNAGTTWTASTLVTTDSFDDSTSFIGDYIAAAASSMGVYAAWCDRRTGENEAEFATTLSGAPGLSRIDVLPPEAWTDTDTPVGFTASGYDQFGQPFPTNPTWEATGGTIASGLYTPQVAGDWLVWANESGISGNAVVHVAPGALARIDVTPPDVTITADDVQQYTATGYDAKGNVAPIAPSWSTTNGSISSGGLFTPQAVGVWSIAATEVGVTGQTTVTVVAGSLAGIWVVPSPVTITADDTQQFLAIGHDSKGNSVSVSPTWGVGEGTISGSGLYTPRRVGTWTVYANASGFVGTGQVIVVPGALARVVVTPADAIVRADQTLQYTATGYDRNDNQVTINPAWSVTAGSINGAGLYVPGPVGVWLVTARAGPISGLTSVTVQPGPLARIDVTPPAATITADDALQLTANGFDVRGNVVAVNPTWDATCGAVDGTGLYVPTPARVCLVYANESGISGSSTVTVLPGRLARIDVTPPVAAITADDVLQYAASGVDAKGNAVAFTPEWAVPEGSITLMGLYTPQRVGVWQVEASSAGVVGTATVTVGPGALAGILVDPSTATITADDTQQFTATGHDAKGNPVPLTAPSWSATDGTVVVGLFTPQRTGIWAVAAEEGGFRGTATVTVRPGAVARVEVEPGDAHVPEGTPVRFSAKAYDGKGNEVPDAEITWSVEGGVGRIDDTGEFVGTGGGRGRVVATATDGSATAIGAATVLVDANALVYLFWGLPLVILLLLLVLLARRRKRKDLPPPSS